MRLDWQAVRVRSGHRQTGDLQSHQSGDDASLQHVIAFSQAAGEQQQAEHGRSDQHLQQGKQAEAVAMALEEGHAGEEDGMER